MEVAHEIDIGQRIYDLISKEVFHEKNMEVVETSIDKEDNVYVMTSSDETVVNTLNEKEMEHIKNTESKR